jgi:cephalosporin hydroxylase
VDLDMTLRSYVRERLSLVFQDSYRGVPMLKFPEDLRAYERFMWEMSADAVIELGVGSGGSTLWFRDRLLGGPPARAWPRRRRRRVVVAVDVAPNPGLPTDVVYVQGDVRDPDLPARVAAHLPKGARPFVVEDTAHTFETTTAALEGFSGLVPDGGYFVVEDGVVDVEALRIFDDWPRGVRQALDEWLARNPRFSRVPAPYLVTCHPGGFLRAGVGAD